MIAITSTGNKVSSIIDLRFAKCAYFCFYEDHDVRFTPNPYCEEESNVAPRAIDWLISQGVSKVITGEIGSKARKYLEEKKIQIILVEEEKASIKSILKRMC